MLSWHATNTHTQTRTHTHIIKSALHLCKMCDVGEGHKKPEKKRRRAQKSVSIKREINYKRLLKLNICAKPLPTYSQSYTHPGTHTHAVHTLWVESFLPSCRTLCQEVNRQSQLFNAFRSACVGVTDTPVSFPALGACPCPCVRLLGLHFTMPRSTLQ